jgi:hypothetical protein
MELFYVVFELDKLSDTRKILEKSKEIITFWRCCKIRQYNPAFFASEMPM